MYHPAARKKRSRSPRLHSRVGHCEVVDGAPVSSRVDSVHDTVRDVGHGHTCVVIHGSSAVDAVQLRDIGSLVVGHDVVGA